MNWIPDFSGMTKEDMKRKTMESRSNPVLHGARE